MDGFQRIERKLGELDAKISALQDSIKDLREETRRDIEEIRRCIEELREKTIRHDENIESLEAQQERSISLKYGVIIAFLSALFTALMVLMVHHLAIK